MLWVNFIVSGIITVLLILKFDRLDKAKAKIQAVYDRLKYVESLLSKGEVTTKEKLGPLRIGGPIDSQYYLKPPWLIVKKKYLNDRLYAELAKEYRNLFGTFEVLIIISIVWFIFISFAFAS